MLLKCHNCGSEADFKIMPKEFVCSVCGAVNVVPQISEAADEPLSCLAPTGFEWQLPAGKIGNPVFGFKYITAQGTQMTREEYLATFKIDPEVALQFMRSHRGVKFGRNM
ncbi:MAG: hypothetical protein N3G75_06280 [Methanothrix sp.]|nr:hypothetical protein [Methanothrix sp.]MCX8207422.1 hypothetical protein [Methanothrix sp.]